MFKWMLASKDIILVHGYHPNTCRPHSYPYRTHYWRDMDLWMGQSIRGSNFAKWRKAARALHSGMCYGLLKCYRYLQRECTIPKTNHLITPERRGEFLRYHLSVPSKNVCVRDPESLRFFPTSKRARASHSDMWHGVPTRCHRLQRECTIP